MRSEINVARTIGICVAAFDQQRDDSLHAVDVLGGTRFDVGRCNANLRITLAELRSHFASEVLPVDRLLLCVVENLVVNIGDVANQGDVIAEGCEPVAHHVIDKRAAKVACMRGALHSWATNIHFDFAINDWLECQLLLAL